MFKQKPHLKHLKVYRMLHELLLQETNLHQDLFDIIINYAVTGIQAVAEECKEQFVPYNEWCSRRDGDGDKLVTSFDEEQMHLLIIVPFCMGPAKGLQVFPDKSFNFLVEAFGEKNVRSLGTVPAPRTSLYANVLFQVKQARVEQDEVKQDAWWNVFESEMPLQNIRNFAYSIYNAIRWSVWSVRGSSSELAPMTPEQLKFYQTKVKKLTTPTTSSTDATSNIAKCSCVIC